MPYDPARHHRRSIRLQGYDYSQPGAYFITIVAATRQPWFGEVHLGTLQLNAAGKMVVAEWQLLAERFPHIELDAFVVMPDHLHGIIVIIEGPSPAPAPGDSAPRGTMPGSIGRIVQAFKSLTTNAYIRAVEQHGWQPFPGRLWQRNYHERVIRSERQLQNTREYIASNPLRWAARR